MFENNLDEIIDILTNVSKFQNTENLQRTTGNIGLARVFELRKLSFLEKLKTSIFLSILEGEFYLIDCKILLENIKREITKIKNTSNKPISVLHSIEEMLEDYSYLNDYVLDRSSNSFQKKIFNFEIERKLFVKNNADYNFLWLFSLNVKLAEIDEGYSSDEKITSTLLRYYHDLNIALQNDYFTNLVSIVSQLKLKCSILLYKILKRIEKTDKIVFDIHNDSFSLSKIEDELRKNQLGNFIVNEIKTQYFTYNININEVSKNLNSNNNFSQIIDVHKLTKYIKKTNLSEYHNNYYNTVLNNLLNKFKNNLRELEVQSHKYIKQGNEIAYATTINLISNTLFIIKSKKIIQLVDEDFSYKNFEKSYKSLLIEFGKAKENEDKNVPNFILYKMYTEQIIKILNICDSKDKSILNDENSKYEKILPEIFDDAFNNLSKYKEKLYRSKELNLMPLYIEIEECNKNKFFLDSQYILPSNYDFLINKYEECWDELKKLERIIFYIIPSNIKESLKDVFKKEVKEHQYSVITIIGLYASFITYVLANVNILPDLIKHSMGAVFAFMLVLGLVLFFFVGTLKLLFSSQKSFDFKYFKVSYFFIWILFAFAITYFALKKIDEYSKVGITKTEEVNSN